jgi:hypothetical protein
MFLSCESHSYRRIKGGEKGADGNSKTDPKIGGRLVVFGSEILGNNANGSIKVRLCKEV